MNPIYSVMILICILSLITMSMLVRCNVTLASKTKMWFIVTFTGIALGMTAEFFRTMMESYPVSNDLYRMVTLMEFCITPIMPIPLSLACGIKKPAFYWLLTF